VMFSSGHGHFPKLDFNLFDDVGHYRVIHMRDLVVANIPGNCALLSSIWLFATHRLYGFNLKPIWTNVFVNKLYHKNAD